MAAISVSILCLSSRIVAELLTNLSLEITPQKEVQICQIACFWRHLTSPREIMRSANFAGKPKYAAQIFPISMNIN